MPTPRRLSALLLTLCTALAGCAGSSRRDGSAPPAAARALVGTWQLVSVHSPGGELRDVDQPFFVRFDEDGQCTLWPAPPNGDVSRGPYTFKDGRLTVPDDLSPEPVRPHLASTEMSYTTSGGGRVYRRVTLGLEPGQLP